MILAPLTRRKSLLTHEYLPRSSRSYFSALPGPVRPYLRAESAWRP